MAIAVPVIGSEIDVVTFGKPVADGVNANTNALAVLDAAWTAYTPVNTAGGSVGAGPATGRYKRLGAKTCTFQLTWTWGTGATGGIGIYSFTFPVPAYASTPDYSVIGTAHLAFSNGSIRKICSVHKLGNACTIFGDFGQLTNSSPQAVAVGDTYYISGTYETA